MSGDAPPLVQGVEEDPDRVPDLLTEPSDCMQKPKLAQASAVTADRHLSEPDSHWTQPRAHAGWVVAL